MLKCSYRPTF